MTQTVWRDTASSACLGAASAETRFAWQILFVQQGFFFKIHFIFWEERKNHLQFASTTTVEVLCASEAVVVSGGEIYLPLIIINYMLVWMEREKKNCEWKLIYQCLDRLAIVQWEIHTTCFMGSVLWTLFCEEFLCGGGIFFFYSPSIRSVVACKFLWMCCTGFPLYL